MNINWNSKVLSSIQPVIENLTYISIDFEKLSEESIKLSGYDFGIKKDLRISDDPDNFIRKTMLINTLNFAFTDFETSTKYALEEDKSILSDTDAMVHQINLAISSGVPILDGSFMAEISDELFQDLFSANIPMPMIKEKVNVLNQTGRILVEQYEGDWINFINDGPRKLYADGKGLIERLISNFSRFDDFSLLEDNKIYFLKLAQLAYWGLHRELSGLQLFHIEDIENMTAFADYILPVALEHLGITKYVPELKKQIQEGKLIQKDSLKEIELRTTSIFVTAKMTEIINENRKDDEKILIPQLDFKLWTEYHGDEKPHHLTKTIMY